MAKRRAIIDESDSDRESSFPLPKVSRSETSDAPTHSKKSAVEELMESVRASMWHVAAPFLAFLIYQLLNKYTAVPPTLPPTNTDILEKKTSVSLPPPVVAPSVSAPTKPLPPPPSSAPRSASVPTYFSL